MRWVLAILLLTGMLLRLAVYLARPSLWLDEATLAINIAWRSFDDLLRPLDFDQVAPAAFLWSERLVTRLFGVHELSLRALPLLAGLAVPPLLYPLARRLLDPVGAVCATGLAALSPILVRYSNETKPYSIDAFVAVVLTSLTVSAIDSRGSRRLAVLIAAGALSVWVSAPAPFVLAGVGGALVMAPSLRERRGALAWIAAGGLLWLASFAAQYATLYREAAGSAYMQRFWEPGFLKPDNAARAVGTVFTTPFVDDQVPTVATVFLCAAGALALARHEGASGPILLLGPIAAALLASMVRLYPLGPRLVLFAAPGLILLLAEGISRLGALAPRALRVPVVCLAAALHALPLVPGASSVSAFRGQESRPVIERLEAAAAGEPVYVGARGVPAWTFYTTDWTSPDDARLHWLSRRTASGGPAFENAPTRGRAVRDEGGDLVYTYRGRTELIGLASGMEWGPWGRVARDRPDPGWAENEAARIRGAARPCAWLFFTALRDGSHVELLRVLGEQGGRRTHTHSSDGAVAHRYCFSTPAR